MIGDNIKVSKSGVVTGTIKYLSGVTDYDEGQQEGHYFPTKFSEENFDKTIHVGGKVSGESFTAGKDITPSEADPYLVIRVENCTDGNKVTVYDKETKDELFTLDFNETTLAPPSGKEAITIPEQGRSFGAWGNASDFIGENLKIEWSGINGKATGDIKWFKGNTKVTEGYHYPIVFNKYYGEDKQVDINGKKLNAQDVIFSFAKTKVITIKYAGKKIAVLDFSNATFKPQTAGISMVSEKPVMSANVDMKNSTQTEEEKRYTKSEINRMSTADLQALAAENGVENAYEMTGTDLKSLLVDMLVN